MKRWITVVVTATLLAALFAIVDANRVLGILSRTTPFLLLLAVMATAFNVLVSSLRYRLILRGMTPGNHRLKDIFAINVVSVFAAHFLPLAAAADGVRIALVKNRFDLNVGHAIESVVADRLIAIVGLCACAIFALPLQALVGAPASLLLSQLIPAAGVLAACVVLAASIRRGRPASTAWIEKVRVALSAVMRHLSHPTTIETQLALALLSALAFAAALWAAARSLGTALTPAEALAFGPAIYLSQVLPFVYFGFGTREAATVFLLAGYATVDADSAFSIGLILGLCNVLVALPAPLLAGRLLRDWRRSRTSVDNRPGNER